MNAPLIIGFAADKTIRHVLRTAEREGRKVSFLELDEFAREGTVTASAEDGEVAIRCGGTTYDLGGGVYQRVFVPPIDVIGAAGWADALARLTALNIALVWTGGLVVNPPFSGWENGSKPLQVQRLRRAGFNVPLSLSTSVRADFEQFASSRETIFKSNSGVRSIVDDVRALEGRRRELLEHSPVLLQERLRGPDVRVHVVGDSSYALRITSDAVDYRYFRTRGSYSSMTPCSDLPPEIERRCLRYAKVRGVPLAGFDFKVVDDVWYCLEMNPSPAFEVFDRHGNGEIASSLLELLASGGSRTAS